MKKILAWIMVATLAMTMLSMPATAAISAGSIRINWVLPTSSGGIFGKGSSEFAKPAVTDTSAEAKSVVITATAPEYDFSEKKYIVIDMNVAPNADAKKISVGPNAGLFALESTDYHVDRWNSVRLVVEEKTADEMMQMGTYQPMTVYINGVKVAEGAHEIHETDELSGTKGKTATFGKGFRISIHGDKSTTVGYVADATVFASDENVPPIMPSIVSGAKFKVDDGNMVTFDDDVNVTLGDIKAANSDVSVSAFVDAGFTVALDDNSKLVKGNVLVVKSADNMYSYYTVASGTYGEKILKCVLDYGGFQPDIGTVDASEVFGIGGRDAEDSSTMITSADNVAWGYSLNTTTSADYLVWEYSILNAGCSQISHTTCDGDALTDNIAAILKDNVWNRVKLVINRKDAAKSQVYVNGVAVLSCQITDTPDIESVCMTLNGNAYIDDMCIYEAKFLRNQETVSVKSGAGYALSGDSMIVPYGGSVAEDMIAHDENCTVKVFGADENGQVAAAAPGCLVAVWSKSMAASDMGCDYNDLFAYYHVVEAAERYEIVTSNPDFTGNNGSSEIAESAVLGNDSGKVKSVVVGKSNNFCQHTWASPTPGAQYLVYSVNIAPVSGENEITGIRFGTDGHSAMSATASVGKHLVKDAWNTVVMVYDIFSGKSDLYVNGDLVSAKFKSAYVSGVNRSLRCIIEGNAQSVCYVDDVYVYESSVVPVVSQPDKLESEYSHKILVDNLRMVANVNSTLTVADVVATAKSDSVVTVFADNTYTTKLNEDDRFSQGNVLVVKSKDNLYTTYDVITHDLDSIVASGDTYDGIGNMTTGTISFYSAVSDGSALIAAQYGPQGNLIKIAIDSTHDNGTASIDFEPEAVDKSKVKAILLKNSSFADVVCETEEICLRDYIDILILGNSYSMDVTWHLRQIAAADDVLMNVCVLNKGGCHLNYHYENRQGDPVALGINFWQNNKVIGTVYNLEQLLEKFDWDYVAIQASSTSEGLDDTSESNYLENWAVAVPFAQYIHENEPEARIVIHSTWSMESGYSFVDDDQERDTILSNMQALNERCASEINSLLGLSGDDEVLIISSSKAVDAARKYTLTEDVTINGRKCEAGTNIFDTTYYKPGHVFIFEEANVRDSVVGDGTMLLGEEDRQSGKISLHRDGFHMSAVGRYLIALNAYATITGNTVTGNGFDSADSTRSDGTIRLDSSPGGLHVTETDTNTSSTVFQIYDVLSPEIRAVCQQIVDSIER